MSGNICPQVLRDNAVQWYGWSFYLAWLGVATCLGTMTLFLIAASCLRREHAREQAQNVQYIMPGDTKNAETVVLTSSVFSFFFFLECGSRS